MTDRMAAQSTLLYEASKLLGAPLHLKGGLDGLLTGVMHHEGLSTCILLLESADGYLQAEHSLGISQTFAQSIRIPRGEGLIGIAYASALPRQSGPPSNGKTDKVLDDLFLRQRLSAALVMPLKAEGRVIGAAFYGSQTLKAFSENNIQELSVLSDHLALALFNNRKVVDLEASGKRLERELAATVQELSRTNAHLIQKVRELKTVYELAIATAASTRVDEIVRLMTGGIKELIGIEGAAFFLFQGSTERLEPVLPAFDTPLSVAQGLGCQANQAKWLSQLVQTKEPQILNLLDSTDSLPPSWRGLKIRSLLALPLLQDGSVRGVFCVINKLQGLFNPDDVRLLSLLTGRVADVIHRISLDEELRRRVNDLSILRDISAQLPSPPVLSDTLAAVGRVTRQALSADVCLFFLYHAESEALAMMGGDWDAKLTFDARALTLGISEKAPLVEVFHTREPATFEKGSASGLWDKDELTHQLDIGHALYLPLKVEQRCVGVLALGLCTPRTFNQEKRRLAFIIAQQVAIVVERSFLYDRLKSANDKLEKAHQMKNEFITMVSHELRTPLTTIKGFVSIVLNEETGPLNSQQLHFLTTSDRAIDRLTLLVSDLLDISRIEAGQIKMQLRPVNLTELCQKLIASFSPQFESQKLSLQLHIPPNLPLVLADPDRLMQVFDNLLANALKFTTQGGVTINAQDKGDFMMVSVKDTGSGIAKDEQERIFDKFYQIKVGGGYPNKGTGLGLAIVKSIVESHRGKVWVESEAGQGADFRFIVPRARPEAQSPPK